MRPRPSLVSSLLRGTDDDVALLTASGAVTYGELGRRVADLAGELGPVRRLVLVEMTGTAAAVTGYLAARHGGHAAMLVPPATALGERLFDRYDPDVLLAAPDDADATAPSMVVRRAGSAHDLHPDLSVLLSTSGSTGSAKLVRLSEENLRSNAAAIGEYLRLSPADVAITSLPLHYCYGLSVLNSHLHAGAAVVCSGASVVEPAFWDAVRAHRVTNIAGVPHTFELLDGCGFPAMDVPSLRFLTQAGGRMEPDVVRRYAELGRARGWDLFVMYGQTEATARMAFLPPDLATSRPGCIGVPIPGGSFGIEPGSGDDLPDGTGELVYSGPNVMLGYADGPADLASGRVVERLPTGDLARQHADGLYEIVGRRSRFVKPFGLRVDLDELERALARAGVEARCAGDDTGVVAALVDPARRAEADAALRAGTGLPASALATVVVVEIPRTVNGKTDYQAILSRRPAPAATEHPHRGEAVRRRFERVLDLPPDSVTGTDSFASLGGDSLTYVELAMHLEPVVGSLPPDWHQRPIDELRPAVGGRRAGTSLDTTVLLRAVAIVGIVLSHASALPLRGGAHLLLVVSGFNFARFQLAPRRDAGPAGSAWRSALRIAGPSVVCIAALQVVTGQFRPAQLLLVNSIIGPASGRGHWRFWYVEVVVQLLVLLGVLLGSRRVRAAERRHALGFAWAMLTATLAARWVAELAPHGTHPRFQLQHVVWLFALGWLLERSRTPGQRALALLGGGAALVGWFHRPSAGLVVFAGAALLAFLPQVPVPSALVRTVRTVAAASLHIYLTHWIVLHVLGDAPAAATVLVALGSGVVLHQGLGSRARWRDRGAAPAWERVSP